jgi:hypothetical protein
MCLRSSAGCSRAVERAHRSTLDHRHTLERPSAAQPAWCTQRHPDHPRLTPVVAAQLWWAWFDTPAERWSGVLFYGGEVRRDHVNFRGHLIPDPGRGWRPIEFTISVAAAQESAAIVGRDLNSAWAEDAPVRAAKRSVGPVVVVNIEGAQRDVSFFATLSPSYNSDG